uniref:Calponin-homology (CH) domain-containing protein n=1 Tax=Parascaris equorum TaxID=6256 RepID=A0A914R9X8_PAREQ
MVTLNAQSTPSQNLMAQIRKMENISNFLEAIKAYGVPEISCFQTVDLYENKQCYKVIECLRALAAVVSCFFFKELIQFSSNFRQ